MESKAIFGGGCFWCVESVFRHVRGVKEVVSGYAGGSRPNPTYEQVCTGATGHAEVVEVTFDSDEIDYEHLVTIFFATHDPTTRDRQGNDRGTQYRSVIFTTSAEQARIAGEVKRALDTEGVFERPIVTEILPLPTFYPAEEYHQRYFERNPDQPYCVTVIPPKLAKLRSKFTGDYRE